MALDFIEPGSCKNPPSYFKDIKVYPDLHLNGTSKPTEIQPNSPGGLIFTIGQPDMMAPGWKDKDLWIGWASGDKEIMVGSLLASAYTRLTGF